MTFLGTGAAMPSPDRVQTGLLLETAAGDGRPLLVDCGAGVLHRLSQTEPGYEALGAVLLTHHHLDHVADLLPLIKARWLAGAESLSIVGPPGTKELVDETLAVHEYLEGRLELRLREVHPGTTFELGGFTIRSRETRHSVQCLAYRFEPAGPEPADDAERATGEPGEFVFSGDSEAFEGLAAFADGARVLAHDCSFPDEIDVDNHPTPRQLGEVLAGHDIDRVYLTHRYPHTDGEEQAMIDSVQAAFDGDVRVAEDGLRFRV